MELTSVNNNCNKGVFKKNWINTAYYKKHGQPAFQNRYIKPNKVFNLSFEYISFD